MIDELKYKILSTAAGDKVVEPTMKSRLADALKWAAASGAFEVGARALLKKKLIVPKSIIPNIAVGAVTGLFDRDLRNYIVRSSRSAIDRDKALSMLKIKHKAAWSFGKDASLGKVVKSVGKRVLGFGLKGAVVGGIGYGAYKGVGAIRDRMRDPKYGQYTTFLRNNVLAGKISPEELSLEDMKSVRERGLK